jgi:hypothetical protein
MRKRWIRRGLKIALLATVIIAVLGGVVVQLWDWLMPSIFGLHPISFWQAIGLLVLSKLLFGGFRGGPGYRGRWRRGLEARWEQMTPEERENFVQGLRSGCGGRGFGKTEPAVASE